jgi:hypothetical protein
LNEGLRLPTIAPYAFEVPSRLGQSSALDDAIACLVNCHSSLRRRVPPCLDLKQENLYAKALLSLQTAVEDPVEGYSENTLAAVTILNTVELYGSVTHGSWSKAVEAAGGASKMIQILGPDYFKSRFAKLLYNRSRGANVSLTHSKSFRYKALTLQIVVSLVKGEDSFLNAPGWRSISFGDIYSSKAEWVLHDMMQEMTALPSLIRKVRSYNASENDANPAQVLRETQQLRRILQEASDFVAASVGSNTEVIELPSAYKDSLIPTVYQFATCQLSSLCVSYWGFSIILDTIVAKFIPQYLRSASVTNLYDRIKRARQQICMSYEYSQQYLPLGTYMTGPLIIGYYGAPEEEKA